MKTLMALAVMLGSTLSYAGGRFELVQLGTARSDQFLLDSQTGKLWRSVCAHLTAGSCDYEIWEPVDVIGITATHESVRKKQEEREKRAAP